MKTNNELDCLNIHLAQTIAKVKAKEFSNPAWNNPRLLYISVSSLLTTFPVIRTNFLFKNSTEALTLAFL